MLGDGLPGDDFRFLPSNFFAFNQSRYSVESCVVQNSRSSSSFLNFGICFIFCFDICLSFPHSHISNEDLLYLVSANNIPYK